MPRIDQYQIGELLGQGGIGRVHAGYDVTLAREVAIKSLRPEYLNDAGYVERFRVEATNLARLNHPNITAVYSLLEQGGSLYMVMERVRGQTLEEVLKLRKSLGYTDSLRIAAQAAEGLAYAHAMGIIHRDIKPANIMITAAGAVKVMDFGIARVRGSQRLTRAGNIIGTLAYMAPEQVRGETTDERSDLYSLGIVLYEMLAGLPPFAADTEYDLMQAHIHAKPRRLRDVMPDADPKIEAILSRALAKGPEQRFTSMQAFRDAMSACIGAARGTDSSIGALASNPVTRVRGKLLGMPWEKWAPLLGASAFAAAVVIWGSMTLFAGKAPDKPPVALKQPDLTNHTVSSDGALRHPGSASTVDDARHHSATALSSDGATGSGGTGSVIFRPPELHLGHDRR
jgi:tRNA A-37 threonylcarbamoyl transferase component Bud32